MHTEHRIYRFGSFELDPGRRRLISGRDPVWLPDRQMDVLLLLTANAGHIVSKDALVEVAWSGLAVTDNSIVQVISRLRKSLGDQPDGHPYIETLARRGYRFNAAVEAGHEPPSLSTTNASAPVSINAALDPFKALVEGRAALETLDRDALDRAGQAFADALRLEPGYSAAHIGVANVCLLRFEATRADINPDRSALEQAEQHAREGCRLDPSAGDAWSTLAVVQHRRGAPADAIAAARKAVALEPQEWRHYLRLGAVSWGAERLRAANRVLSLCPGLALGHWFAATIFIARGAFDAALEHLRAGCAAQDAQQKAGGRFTAVGLHLLHGLVLAARVTPSSPGDMALANASEEFARELAFEASGHVYARECCANTWYAIGALALRQGRRDEALADFQEALARVPGHALAIVGMGTRIDGLKIGDGTNGIDGIDVIDRAMVGAAALALKGKHLEAARLCEAALVRTEAGSAGYLLPIDPLLQATAHPDVWARTLAILRDRAV